MRKAIQLRFLRISKVRRVLPLFFSFLCLTAGPAAWGADKGFETPPTLKAADVLPAMLEGRRYKIEDKVPTDGFLMKFTIQSDFGTFIARSPEMAAAFTATASMPAPLVPLFPGTQQVPAPKS